MPRSRHHASASRTWAALALTFAVLSGSLLAQDGDCFELRAEIECVDAAAGVFTVRARIVNAGDAPIDRIFVWGEGATSIAPDAVSIEPLGTGESSDAIELRVELDATTSATVEISVHDSQSGACCARTISIDRDLCEGAIFRRGDMNHDGDVDISDGIGILRFLFLGGPSPACRDAADANDTGDIDLSDAIGLFNYLFLGGRVPPAPGPVDCGPDPTDDRLDCLDDSVC